VRCASCLRSSPVNSTAQGADGSEEGRAWCGQGAFRGVRLRWSGFQDQGCAVGIDGRTLHLRIF
jgi:hypothetical protein